MKLVDMAMSKAERERRYEPAKMTEDAPVYPWGLSITLDNDTIEKLGTGVVPMEVGEEVTIVAKARVTSCSSNETEGGSNKNVSLQLVKLGIGDAGDAGESAAGKLYDGDKAEK